MKKIFICMTAMMLMLTGCMKNEMPDYSEYQKQQINENVQKVFGTTFDPNHTWCTTTAGQITISDIPAGTECVSLLVYVKEDDGETSMLSLNQADVNGRQSVTLNYDAPTDNLGLFVAFLSKTNIELRAISQTASTRAAMTRGADTEEPAYTLPTGELRISIIEDSYASKRGWIPGEKLYQMADYTSQKMSVADYSDEYKAVFRAMIFSYFKNGRKYNNLPLVQRSACYNADSYPFTTGKEPIVVSPVYKNDGGYQEVVNSDLYYYYYKDADIAGKDAVKFIEQLPKYKAIQFDQCIAADDEIKKHASYALVYWGDRIPDENTVGSYQFPEGYRIGFMVRAKTTAEGGKKQGELYGDGRLNNYINNYGNFKSSKLGTDGPRSCWMTVNGKMLLCFESGTDADMNDIVMQIEGGVEPIIYIPELEETTYTFCFEDTELGDYDMNDVVIKAKRLNETTVQWSIVACGAYDQLQVKNINGTVINDNAEVHSLFGVDNSRTYINTVSGMVYTPVSDQVRVDKNFSFLDESSQPYIYDMTTSKTVKLSKRGEDPHGIMIPKDFRWPIERVCIKNAYLQFNSWGENQVTSTDWYLHPEEDKVI